jgi:hypothetical protein
MAILNPEHLLEQAERLAAPPPAGAPRQVDLRRAVSSGYYALFHFLLAAAADEFIGANARSTPRYALLYRNIEHASLRHICAEVQKSTPRPKLRAYFPEGGFHRNIRGFGRIAVELQTKRHDADYDPLARFTTLDVRVIVGEARAAITAFKSAPGNERLMFLTLLVTNRDR